MTMGLIWLLIIFLIPVIGFYLLRINAALVFLSLCLGYVLFAFDAQNASKIVGSLSNVGSLDIHLKPTAVVVNLLLLLGPAVITLISQIGSVSDIKKILNILPSIGVGLFTILLVVPILPHSIMSAVVETSYWSTIVHNKASIVGIGAGVAILFFWFTLYKGNMKKHHHSGSKS